MKRKKVYLARFAEAKESDVSDLVGDRGMQWILPKHTSFLLLFLQQKKTQQNTSKFALFISIGELLKTKTTATHSPIRLLLPRRNVVETAKLN